MIERNGYTDDNFFAGMSEEDLELETAFLETDADVQTADAAVEATEAAAAAEDLSAEKPLSFEAAMERLEELVKKMESGRVSLDESLELFKEGSELAQFCRRKLSDNENKIKQLLESAEGFREEDFHV